MRRREFLSVLSGAVVARPLAARAQQTNRVYRIGVLMNLAADDPQSKLRLTAFLEGLKQLGWSEGRNVRFEVRWASGDIKRARQLAAELVALAPDVIVASGNETMGPLSQTNRTIPVVFVHVTDPVGGGYVDSLARPGRNATGFSNFEYGTSGKWLELLKEIAPNVTRVAVLRDLVSPAGTGQFGAIQAVAPSLGVEVQPVDEREAREIERAITAFARSLNGGLIITAATPALVHRKLIIALAARHKLPAVYSQSLFVAGGGLISYGPDRLDQYRRAGSYVDHILKGGKPAELPVQAPVKAELVINLKTAKTLGLTVPPTLLSRADEVIE